MKKITKIQEHVGNRYELEDGVIAEHRFRDNAIRVYGVDAPKTHAEYLAENDRILDELRATNGKHRLSGTWCEFKAGESGQRRVFTVTVLARLPRRHKDEFDDLVARVITCTAADMYGVRYQSDPYAGFVDWAIWESLPEASE